jgi:hypothetical protein
MLNELWLPSSQWGDGINSKFFKHTFHALSGERLGKVKRADSTNRSWPRGNIFD